MYFLSLILQLQIRSEIIQQLKVLKVLEESGVLTAGEFQGQTVKRNVKSLNIK